MKINTWIRDSQHKCFDFKITITCLDFVLTVNISSSSSSFSLFSCIYNAIRHHVRNVKNVNNKNNQPTICINNISVLYGVMETNANSKMFKKIWHYLLNPYFNPFLTNPQLIIDCKDFHLPVRFLLVLEETGLTVVALPSVFLPSRTNSTYCKIENKYCSSSQAWRIWNEILGGSLNQEGY